MNHLIGTAPPHLEPLGLCAQLMLLILHVARLGEQLDSTAVRP